MLKKQYIHSPTRLRHMSIHKGTNTTSQDQLMKSSNFSAKNMNCRIFTAQNNSNWKSHDLNKIWNIHIFEYNNMISQFITDNQILLESKICSI